MKITRENIAPKVNTDYFFDDADCFYNFRNTFLSARRGLTSSLIYLKSDTVLYQKLSKIRDELDGIEIED
jgi:hypothetical protein